LAVVNAVDYRGAGTVEFVSNAQGELFFLEVNARLQVEHPVTEAVTGLDLVELQLLIASGTPMTKAALNPTFTGHAIEARIYAEDPSKNFIPQPGKIERLVWPEVEGVRIDAGVIAGNELTAYYDPLIAKVIAHGSDRKQAISRLDEALAKVDLALLGPKGPRATNLEFLRGILKSDAFASGNYDTSLAEKLLTGR
jgi:acetyl/propionyl-CoA carboxylase alpha subunit